MSIRTRNMTKEKVLEIIRLIRHLPQSYLRDPNSWHCCPFCDKEFEDSIGEDEKYPSELDLVYEYIKENVKE